jgi:hypothetical protein
MSTDVVIFDKISALQGENCLLNGQIKTEVDNTEWQGLISQFLLAFLFCNPIDKTIVYGILSTRYCLRHISLPNVALDLLFVLVNSLTAGGWNPSLKYNKTIFTQK